MTSHRHLVTLLAGLASVQCMVLNPRQSTAPPSGTVNIRRVETSGNGCTKNSVKITVNPDQSVVLERLNNFHASVGPNIPPTEKSKICVIHVEISYPAGFQFLLSQSQYSGYVRLDRGVSGHFYTHYYLSSAPSNSFLTQADTAGDGFLTGAEFVIDKGSINSNDLWSSCTKSDTAHFSNRVALDIAEPPDPNASGELWGNGALTQTITTSWRRC